MKPRHIEALILVQAPKTWYIIPIRMSREWWKLERIGLGVG